MSTLFGTGFFSGCCYISPHPPLFFFERCSMICHLWRRHSHDDKEPLFWGVEIANLFLPRLIWLTEFVNQSITPTSFISAGPGWRLAWRSLGCFESAEVWLVKGVIGRQALSTKTSEVCNKKLLLGAKLFGCRDVPSISNVQFVLDTMHTDRTIAGLSNSPLQPLFRRHVSFRGCKCPEELEDIEHHRTTHPWQLKTSTGPIPWSLVPVKGENSCCCTDGWRRKITGWLGWSGDSPVVFINGSQSLSFTCSLPLINMRKVKIAMQQYIIMKYIWYLYHLYLITRASIYSMFTYIHLYNIYIFSRYIYIYVYIHAFALNGNSQVLTSFEKLFSCVWWHWTHLAHPRGDPFAGANRRIGQENSGLGGKQVSCWAVDAEHLNGHLLVPIAGW